MFHKLFTRRRGVAIFAVAIGTSMMSLASAGTAGAFWPRPPSSPAAAPTPPTT